MGHTNGTGMAARFSAAWDPACEHSTRQRTQLGLVQKLFHHHFYTKAGVPTAKPQSGCWVMPVRNSLGIFSRSLWSSTRVQTQPQPQLQRCRTPRQPQGRWGQQGTSPPPSQQSSFPSTHAAQGKQDRANSNGGRPACKRLTSAPAVSLGQGQWHLAPVISQPLIMQSKSYKQQLRDTACSSGSGKAPFPFWLPSESAPLASAGHNLEDEHTDLGLCSRLSPSG